MASPFGTKAQKNAAAAGWAGRRRGAERFTLETVLFGLGQTVSLVYKTDEPISKDHAYFQVWLDKDGNLTACPDDENGSDG